MDSSGESTVIPPSASILRLQGHPDVDRSDERPGRGLADVDALGSDQFTGFAIEGDPGLRHAAELHLLNGSARGRVHDGGYDAHPRGASEATPDLSSLA